MTHLVVLGIGYGGHKILNTLISKGLPADLEITVIDRLPFHTLKTEFYALAVGTIEECKVSMKLPSHPQVRQLTMEVKSIDLDSKEVYVDNTRISYDHLVIGLGCEDHYHGVDGAKEYTDSIQSIFKANATYNKIKALEPNAQVTIIGGGLSGVELASELRESRSDLKIQILERGQSVLSPFSDKVKKHASKWFEKHEVQVVPHSTIEKIELGKVYCSGQIHESDIIIWTAGVKPNALLDNLPVEKDKSHKILLNEYHQIPTHPEVYVVGDCAALPFPPSAQLAEAQGEQIAKVLLDIWNNVELSALPPFKLSGTLGSLGKHDGFAIVFDKSFTGFIPRTLKSSLLWAHKHHLH